MRYRPNPLSQSAWTGIAVGAGLLALGGIAYAIAGHSSAAAASPPSPSPTPPPPPTPTPPPAPNPPPPPIPPVPPPPNVGQIAPNLVTGQSYSISFSTTRDLTTITAVLESEGYSAASITCLPGGICTGTTVWAGVNGHAPPNIAGITYIGLLPLMSVGGTNAL